MSAGAGLITVESCAAFGQSHAGAAKFEIAEVRVSPEPAVHIDQ